MMTGTLARYFGWRFLSAVIFILSGLLVLVAMVDFVEMMRRTSDMKDVSALTVAKVSLYRVPHLTERVLPFTVMAAAMMCYVNLSRRLELVVARSAGISAWQFVGPAVILALLLGIAATTLYNPLSASLREQSVKLESELFRGTRSFHDTGNGFWVRQHTAEGHAVVNARSSSEQGVALSDVTVFRFDDSDRFLQRIEAKSARLHAGFWRLEGARIFAIETAPVDRDVYDLKTHLTQAQVRRESFASPDTVPFWQLSAHIGLAETAGLAAAGYRVHYYQLLLQPFYLAAMVLLAASVSLRSFRFGGVQQMILGGIIVGFLLYVMSKVTGDLSKAGLIAPVVAAALPPLVGGLTGVMMLLCQEDG
jgi:lipopolysaccharide export system permease protein